MRIRIHWNYGFTGIKICINIQQSKYSSREFMNAFTEAAKVSYELVLYQFSLEIVQYNQVYAKLTQT